MRPLSAVVALGVVLCASAVIIGLRTAMHATVSPCPNGRIVPAGMTDFRCFTYRHAGDDTVIVLFAFAILAILAIAGVTARQLLSRPS